MAVESSDISSTARVPVGFHDDFTMAVGLSDGSRMEVGYVNVSTLVVGSSDGYSTTRMAVWYLDGSKW